MSKERSNATQDANLVSRCLAGDEAAWRTLAGILLRLAKSWFARRTTSYADAEDLTQQTVLALLNQDSQALRRYDASRARLSTYLAVIMVRQAPRQSLPPPLPLDPELEELLPGGSTPEEGDDRYVIWQTGRQVLSETDLLILHLTAQGFPTTEIADVLARAHGKPFTVENVRQHRSRAITRLRQELSR